MQTITEFPNPVVDLEHVWIKMADGTRLSARIWLPEDAEQNPVPAILEYIPYRKRDSIRLRDETIHPYFAGHGYAAVRVDLRGSGDSEGLLQDEYLQQELDDGLEVIRWIAEQPWCDGHVGMIGISWGGFNGLQLAALQPPALKAVISVASSDDRYADDVHHMGGCLLGDNLSWASTMFAYNALPPDPELVGSHWREIWMQRLEHSGLWLEQWLRHQRRDAYWRHASICEDYSALRCPVMLVSGWADGYTNAVFRMLANLEVPRLGIVGPWSHKYPHLGVPGPAIGFLQEALRWWDHWLKGTDTGVMQEPMLRAWMQESVPPTTHYRQRPGRWVGERSWPSARILPLRLRLAPHQLLPETAENDIERRFEPRFEPWAEPKPEPNEASQYLHSPLGLGLFAGKWCSYAAAPDLPHDQRQEDGGALTYDSSPLKEPLEILGNPSILLELSADRPVAMVAVRLSDIAPDNKATRVTFGLLNLTHRDSSDAPTPLEPGRRYRVRVDLNNIGYAFPAGHRLRIAVSSSYWPMAWPAPESVGLSVYSGSSMLTLPARPPATDDAETGHFGPAEGAAPSASQMLSPSQHSWRVIRDLETDVSTLEVINDQGERHLSGPNLTDSTKALEWYSYYKDEFDSPYGETLWERSLTRGEWRIRTRTRTRLTSDSKFFYLIAELDAWEHDKRVYSRNWDYRIERDLV
ncbi:MAG: CocE/NonD family hydrolase [Halochromatium sp.]|uniref:CocE/NonD family hydrolase n=1 Tax=Halochromatium sp. TaxID=2049430 RepID=UPI00397D56AF